MRWSQECLTTYLRIAPLPVEIYCSPVLSPVLLTLRMSAALSVLGKAFRSRQWWFPQASRARMLPRPVTPLSRRGTLASVGGDPDLWRFLPRHRRALLGPVELPSRDPVGLCPPRGIVDLAAGAVAQGLLNSYRATSLT